MLLTFPETDRRDGLKFLRSDYYSFLPEGQEIETIFPQNKITDSCLFFPNSFRGGAGALRLPFL